MTYNTVIFKKNCFEMFLAKVGPKPNFEYKRWRFIYSTDLTFGSQNFDAELPVITLLKKYLLLKWFAAVD